MALEVVGGAFLSALFQEVFRMMASREVMDYIRGKKQTQRLLDKLKSTLRSVNVVLDDAEEKQIINSDVKEWLDELKDAVYDAEELLSDIKTEVLKRKLEADRSGSSTSKVQQLFSDSFPSFDKGIDPKIEEIFERLDFIAKEKDVLDLKIGVTHRTKMRLLATSLVEDSSVYGREEDKERITKLLLSDDVIDDRISVIPIVGMGGIGKTTVAQLVYNDVRVKQHFDLLAWVCVSDEFDIVRVTQVICGFVTLQTCDIADLNLLQVKLKEALTGKKFLFVLDDVWNENYIHWDILRHPFEFGAHGSKIIVTTRNESVASMMGTLPAHHLIQISEEDCWWLFAKHAFQNASVISAHPNLEVIGRQIVRKCKGLPLAAKSLGGLLRSKFSMKEWENVLKSDLWELSNKESNILPALWLSYYYLPPHLKRCFAYCSVFPKGYEFTKSRLVLLWMAEDFLRQEKKKPLEEVGVDYFNELVSRSFFQHSSSVHNGYIMHDLINDLAKFVSGEFCLRLEDNDSFDIVRKTRHFSFLIGRDGRDYEKFEALYKAKYLHTFLSLPQRNPTCSSFQLLDTVLNDLLPWLQCLRVLTLSYYTIKELPNSFSNLKHLRYLDLSSTLLEKLPETLCTLYNLQTLLVSYCRALTQLPTNLGALINLRHLDIEGTKLERMPPHIGKLKDLRTLSEFVLDKRTGHNIVELKELKHLCGKFRMVGLHHIDNVTDASEASIRDKNCLNELSLEWEGDTDNSQKDREVLDSLQPHTNIKILSIHFYGGTRFPSWLGDFSYSNLVGLKLVNCGNCCFLPPLGQLPSLRDLSIEGLNGVVSIGPEFYGYGSSCGIKSFRCLKVLKFCNMQELQEWCYIGFNEDDGAFPNLSQLGLLICPKLSRMLPLDCFPKLEKLKLFGTNLESLTVSQESHSSSLLFFNYLDIFLCPNFVCFPNGGLRAANLTEIKICGCEKLRSLPEQMHTLLPSLHFMLIRDCPELESFPEGGLPSQVKSLSIFSCKKLIANRMQWGLRTLTSLRNLKVSFENSEEPDMFPEKGLLPTTITSVFISHLSNLDGKGFRHLTSLENLTIVECPELQRLPEEGLPASLSELILKKCPLLQQRCQSEGEDWPKIAHIPRIEIDGEPV
ncbi:disease resistance protein [Pyrus ussuriensis x Pyrus communis]|uniref:Disease resistance protein n=1 Tax=Pyrus ussuriensis x Pyrus communis TaxID=2448454 RepID=A0A5N5FY21_9ROSA|nr:disease resistance protein [Pyrus ussuriensis x Pyrus communis]